MKREEIICKLFGFTPATFYNWKKEKRPIVMYIDKFSNEELKYILFDKENDLKKDLDEFMINKSLFNLYFYLDKLASRDFYEFEHLSLYPDEDILNEILDNNPLYIIFKFLTTNFSDNTIDFMIQNIASILNQKYTIENLEDLFNINDDTKDILFELNKIASLNYFYNFFNEKEYEKGKINIYKHNLIYNMIIDLKKEYKNNYRLQNELLLDYYKKINNDEIIISNLYINK